MLLDYFASVKSICGTEAQRLFGWDKASAFCEGELNLVGRVCAEMGFDELGGGKEDNARLLTGEAPELLHLCPELRTLRDVVFLLKLFLCPTAEGLPPRKRWKPSDAALHWSHGQKVGVVQ